MLRRSLVGLLIVAGPAIAWSAEAASPCWSPPVEGEVVDPFREPPCRWCPGNRGIEYRVGAGATVRAASSGTVVFSGSVAGTRYVVVELPSGWRVTYGRLTSTQWSTGDRLLARSVVGTASGDFYFGVRVDGTYVDPEPYLGAFVGRPRLIPVDGHRARPSGPATLRCHP